MADGDLLELSPLLTAADWKRSMDLDSDAIATAAFGLVNEFLKTALLIRQGKPPAPAPQEHSVLKMVGCDDRGIRVEFTAHRCMTYFCSKYKETFARAGWYLDGHLTKLYIFFQSPDSDND